MKPKWIGAIIAIIIAISIAWFLKSQQPDSQPGCYDFADGTVQGWTLDQFYDGNTNFDPQRKFEVAAPGTPANPGLKTGTPFTFRNHQNLSLEANAPSYVVTDPNVKTCDIYFESPILSSNPDWQNTVGYKLDIERDISSPYGDQGNLYNVQLQVRVSGKLYVESDANGNFIFHQIKAGKGYSLEWKPPILSNQQYKIDKVRIRFIMPGYSADIENSYKGSWRIGNICPIM